MSVLATCTDLHTVVLTDLTETFPEIPVGHELGGFVAIGNVRPNANIDTDIRHSVYSRQHRQTQGVVLSHRNIVTGAKSVAQYWISSPTTAFCRSALRFDYRLNQQPALLKGACCILMDYFCPRTSSRL